MLLCFIVSLIQLVKGAEYFEIASEKLHPFSSDESKVVFRNKPFDYEVDLPLVLSELVLEEPLMNFNPYFSLLSQPCLTLFFEKYFEMFRFLFPGLKNVPAYPGDFEGLIVFSIFRMYADASESPENFALIAAELCQVFSDTDLFDKLEALTDFSLEATNKLLFCWAVENRNFYTVEAFLVTGLETFSRETLLAAINSGKLSGDYRLVNRIASGVDPEVRREVFSAEVDNCFWPEYKAASFSYSHLFKIPKEKSESHLFRLTDNLGEGAYSNCWKAVSHTTGKTYALKIFKKQICHSETSESLKRVKKEITIQQSLAHKGVVKLYRVLEDSRSLYFLLELCQYKRIPSLFEMGQISEVKAAPIIRQILSALQYIHSSGVIHRDIKAENLLLQEPGPVVKIADFGFSTFVPVGGKTKTACGSVYYMAPEVVTKTPYSFEVDIWSLGVTLFAILSGRYPFPGKFEVDAVQKILKGGLCFSSHVILSDSVKDIIKKMLKYDPSERITIDQMLSHPFLSAEPIQGNGAIEETSGKEAEF